MLSNIVCCLVLSPASSPPRLLLPALRPGQGRLIGVVCMVRMRECEPGCLGSTVTSCLCDFGEVNLPVSYFPHPQGQDSASSYCIGLCFRSNELRCVKSSYKCMVGEGKGMCPNWTTKYPLVTWKRVLLLPTWEPLHKSIQSHQSFVPGGSTTKARGGVPEEDGCSGQRQRGFLKVEAVRGLLGTCPSDLCPSHGPPALFP